jgi:amidase
MTIAVKDNIAVASVKCTNGTGGIIKGKAACENNCFGAVRFVVTAIASVHAKP